MNKFLQNRDGGSTVESALVVLPVLLFILGIMQTAYIVWVGNMLQYAVDYAARCGAVNSTTYPCSGNSTANMQSTANALFVNTHGAGSPTFAANTCAGTGLTGTIQVSILSVANLTLTAKSCYPT